MSICVCRVYAHTHIRIRIYADTHTHICAKAYAYFAYILGRLFLSGTVASLSYNFYFLTTYPVHLPSYTTQKICFPTFALDKLQYSLFITRAEFPVGNHSSKAVSAKHLLVFM